MLQHQPPSRARRRPGLGIGLRSRRGEHGMSARDAVDEHRTSHHRSESGGVARSVRETLWLTLLALLCASFTLPSHHQKRLGVSNPCGSAICEAARPHIDSRGAQAGRQVRCRPHALLSEGHSMRVYAAQARMPDNCSDDTAAT